MYEFSNAISVSGLGDDIHSAMTQNAQQSVVEKIMSAAKHGHTDCEISIKGTTPAFLAQLEEEGVFNIAKENSITLFWEW